MGVRVPAFASVLGILLGAALPAAPAGAHGALENPASRATGCEPGRGAERSSAACRAAAKVSGRALAEWDELRVPNVGGRDRRMIPDGELCSAGIERFRGLDLPRADWPATRLTSGARHTFRYRVSIPHRGSLRMFVTRAGYRPDRPLTWSALEAEPFLKVKDPPRRNGAYVFSGRIPRGKTGRHLIYTVWQTSDTPDTYYSCSDVTFGAVRKKPAKQAPSPKRTDDSPAPGGQAAGGSPGPVDVSPSPVAGTSPAGSGRSWELLLAAGGVAAVALIFTIGGAVMAVRRMRLRREL
ncbi:lytic polysaccharide monooxygenase [Actinomadura sp. B10D3]|uniref:lytic polysaccharide monooxygenase auxiliary activity family 9 protein n=1 Tax=Actinomadura sp. B10D3 TaxID=3153557 RepID=UPI00325E56C1